VATWRTAGAWPGGAAINEVTPANFTNPSSAEADRIPEIALAVGGTPGSYVITGTWNSAAQTDTILTVANATVKGTKPFDTITSFVGPDPVAALTLNKGDSYADPPCRFISTGSADGNIACQLEDETAVGAAEAVDANSLYLYNVQRVATVTTTLVGAKFVW
jgi:hypothetical protein